MNILGNTSIKSGVFCSLQYCIASRLL